MSNRKRFAEALEFSHSVLRGSAFLFMFTASTATPLFSLQCSFLRAEARIRVAGKLNPVRLP
jgi:hypothetical protein